MDGLELTTLARVKAKAELTGTTHDVVIADLIKAISERARNFLGRHTKIIERTESFQFQPRRRYLSLPGMPIDTEQTVTVWPSATRNFADAVALESSAYQVLAAEGQIFLPYFTGGAPEIFLQVRYTGGMAVDTTAFLSTYPDIADGVENEIIARLNRKKQPEGNLQGLDGQVTFLKALEPLKDFYDALSPHRRLLR